VETTQKEIFVTETSNRSEGSK